MLFKQLINFEVIKNILCLNNTTNRIILHYCLNRPINLVKFEICQLIICLFVSFCDRRVICDVTLRKKNHLK